MPNPRKAYHAARYAERRAKGLCICGAKAVPGKTKCRKHLKQQRNWNQTRNL